MSKHLIIPAAGQSSRFPGMRPKWCLTHPNGTPMLVEAITGLPLDEFDTIHIGLLRAHTDQHMSAEAVKQAFADRGISNPLTIDEFDKPTTDQVNTCEELISRNNIDGIFMIKDCDNFFSVDKIPEQGVGFSRLSRNAGIPSGNKSYIEMTDDLALTNIVEKQVIGDLFSVGGYVFKSAETFLRISRDLDKFKSTRFVSNIMYQAMLESSVFECFEVDNYKDWGTANEWLKYCNRYVTIFCDIDGVLIQNGARYIRGRTWGENPALKENIQLLTEMHATERAYIVLTTSRPEEFRHLTVEELGNVNMPYDQLVMGLPHARRILINDYSGSNLYPSAISINLQRDSTDLADYLQFWIDRRG